MSKRKVTCIFLSSATRFFTITNQAKLSAMKRGSHAQSSALLCCISLVFHSHAVNLVNFVDLRPTEIFALVLTQPLLKRRPLIGSLALDSQSKCDDKQLSSQLFVAA